MPHNGLSVLFRNGSSSKGWVSLARQESLKPMQMKKTLIVFSLEVGVSRILSVCVWLCKTKSTTWSSAGASNLLVLSGGMVMQHLDSYFSCVSFFFLFFSSNSDISLFILSPCVTYFLDILCPCRFMQLTTFLPWGKITEDIDLECCQLWNSLCKNTHFFEDHSAKEYE